MSHRTQITLTDEQYALLCDESRRTGVGLAELVRRAVDRSYGQPTIEERLQALHDSFGAWQDRDFDGEQYVERLRRGMAHRLGSE